MAFLSVDVTETDVPTEPNREDSTASSEPEQKKAADGRRSIHRLLRRYSDVRFKAMLPQRRGGNRDHEGTFGADLCSARPLLETVPIRSEDS
jgi:hypothetical protein